jgi:DNA ligase-1
MLLREVVAASERVAATRSRNAKVAIIADLLARADPAEVEVLAHFLAGRVRQRRTGVGWRSLGGFAAAAEPSLAIVEVDTALQDLSDLAGPGSQLARQAALADLMGRATHAEQRYLGGLLVGETRQGALEGVLLQAIGQAYDAPSEVVRRAAMMTGSVPATAAAAAIDGAAGLARLRLQVGRPVLPMLASSARTVAEALARVASGIPVAVETKLDGVRIQAHKQGADVRIHSRSLDDITVRLPEIRDAVAALPCATCVLDGEALAFGPSGQPMAFQDTAARSASAGDPAGVALSPFFFDLLELDGTDLVDSPARLRQEHLARLVPDALRVRRLVTADPEAADRFARAVLDEGHEGVVVKDLAQPYQAGRRGTAWVKVKPVLTLDLVVLAVERGSGRRRGWLSNIHLGARDPASGGFVMLGKTFKGMTDEVLAWQTRRFEQLMTADDGWVVQVRPEQVVEVAFDGLQRSTRYPGGVALRFARVVRYRDDKSATEADTIETVRGLVHWT